MASTHRDRIAKRTKWTFILIAILVTAITGSALADVLFKLGWGYHWKDVLAGVGMLVWDGLIYLACLGMFRFVDTVRRP